MKKVFLLITIVFGFITEGQGQITADFEDAELGGENFIAGGFEFSLSDDLQISGFEDFSCDGTMGVNKYIDSGYLDGSSEGVLGSITPVNPMVTFQLSTSASQCGYPASDDGDQLTSGSIKFVGTKMDDATIEEIFDLAPINFTELLPFTFSETIWDAIDLKSLQIEIAGTQDSTDYFALDNLVFASIDLATSISPIPNQLVDIFPNPTNGLIRVQGDAINRVEVVDIHGRVLISTDYDGKDIDISSASNGVYIVKVHANDTVANQLIIKE